MVGGTASCPRVAPAWVSGLSQEPYSSHEGALFMYARQLASGYQKRLIFLIAILGFSLATYIGCFTQTSKPTPRTRPTANLETTKTTEMEGLESYLRDLGIEPPMSCPPSPAWACIEFAAIEISLHWEELMNHIEGRLVDAGIDPWYTSPVCHSMGKYLKAMSSLGMSQSARDVLINTNDLVASLEDVAHMDFLVTTGKVDFPMVRFTDDRECITSIDPQFFTAR